MSAHDDTSIAHWRDSSLTQLSCFAAEPPLDVIVITVEQNELTQKTKNGDIQSAEDIYVRTRRETPRLLQISLQAAISVSGVSEVATIDITTSGTN